MRSETELGNKSDNFCHLVVISSAISLKNEKSKRGFCLPNKNNEELYLIRSRTLRHRRQKTAEINMAPLIDMVFILLIFFIVTTSFIKESGVEIQRPTAQTASRKESINLLVEVSRDGTLYIDGEPIDIRMIRPRMKRLLTETPKASVVVVADKTSQTGTVIEVLDECRLAGIENISVAARSPES